MHELETQNWIAIPFSVNGVNYLSKIKPESTMAKRIKVVPPQLFVEMNQGAVRELIGNLSIQEIPARLYEINQGASEAVIEIV